MGNAHLCADSQVGLGDLQDCVDHVSESAQCRQHQRGVVVLHSCTHVNKSEDGGMSKLTRKQHRTPKRTTANSELHCDTVVRRILSRQSCPFDKVAYRGQNIYIRPRLDQILDHLHVPVERRIVQRVVPQLEQ